MIEAARNVIATTAMNWESEMDTFLNSQELATLTGARLKKKQIDQLKKMGIPFYVNAAGRAVVVRSVIEGIRGKIEPAPQRGWMPRASAA